MKFIQATNFNKALRTEIDLIVIHTMEAPEKPGTANQVAEWFANRGAPKYPAPKASAHFCIDDKEIIQCVWEHDVAWHAPGANHNGIGIELTGYAKQTEEEWKDNYSTSMLENAAKLCAVLSLRYNIPLMILKADQLIAKKRGFTTHAEVSLAFKKSNHTDPGPNFPWRHFLNLVNGYRECIVDEDFGSFGQL
jgi:N-acetyl-anhydromuramyl-L-alanine amidase AmpD